MKSETILNHLLKNQAADFPAAFFGILNGFHLIRITGKLNFEKFFISMDYSESSETASDQKFSPENLMKKIFLTKKRSKTIKRNIQRPL